MYLKGKLLVLLGGTLPFIWATSHFQDNGDQTINKPSLPRFVLVIDNSNSMSSHHQMDHLRTNAIRWITQLKPGTMVSIVKFGSSGHLVEAVPGMPFVDAAVYQQELIKAINSIQSNGGGCNMASGLKLAEQIMLDPNSPNRGYQNGGVVIAFTAGQINEGADVGSEAVWGNFKHNSIIVTTILMGVQRNADIEALSRKTNGKVFTVDIDGKDLDDPFAWSSQSWMSPEVVNNYDWGINNTVIPGTMAVPCDAPAHQCIYAQLEFDQTNKDITITIRMAAHGGNPVVEDYIDTVQVEDPDSGDIIHGWKYSVDSFQNKITLRNHHPDAGQYRIDIRFKKRINVQFVVQVKVTGHKNSPNAEPYEVTCRYPSDLSDGQFLITGQVKQGDTVVKGATIAARVSKSMDDEPSGTVRSCYVKVSDDGLEQYSGDLKPFDGVHSYILDPRNFCSDISDLSSVERMQVMCTMLSSPDISVDENHFFS